MAASKHGLAMVYGQIQVQAAMLALNDIYWTLFWMALVLIPILLVSWIWANSKMERERGVTAAPDAAAMAH